MTTVASIDPNVLVASVDAHDSWHQEATAGTVLRAWSGGLEERGTMDMAKAEESLKAAELCYTTGLYNSAASRAYYAMFQAAQVALERAGFKRPEWSHTALRAAFANELTRRRKLYSPFLARYLTLGLELRLVADYEEGEVSGKRAERGVRWAKEFVEQMKEGLSHG
jgi:uncharacterized protein (UPF0332 family)